MLVIEYTDETTLFLEISVFHVIITGYIYPVLNYLDVIIFLCKIFDAFFYLVIAFILNK